MKVRVARSRNFLFNTPFLECLDGGFVLLIQFTIRNSKAHQVIPLWSHRSLRYYVKVWKDFLLRLSCKKWVWTWAIGNMDFEFSPNVVSIKQQWNTSTVQLNYHLTVSSAVPCLCFLHHLLQISVSPLFFGEFDMFTFTARHFKKPLIPSSSQLPRKPPKAALKPPG